MDCLIHDASLGWGLGLWVADVRLLPQPCGILCVRLAKGRMQGYLSNGSGKIWSALQLIGECILYACLLGIAMDMATAHLAPGYFIMKQPKLTESTEPFVLALVWGIGASWWFGAIAGLLLAIQNWLRREPLPLSVIRVRILKAVVTIWLILMALLGGFYLLIGLLPQDARRPTFDLDRRMMSVALTHMTEYVIGAIAMVVVMVKLMRLPAKSADASRS